MLAVPSEKLFTACIFFLFVSKNSGIMKVSNINIPDASKIW